MSAKDRAGASRGRAIALAVGAVLLLVAAGAALRGGYALGWILLAAAVVAAGLAWAAARTGSGSGSGGRVLQLPGPDEPTYLEPPSNVRRIG